MTIGIDAKIDGECDKCGRNFDEGDNAYCSSCWNDLIDEIKDRDREIEGWEADLSTAMDKIEELKAVILSLEK